MAVYAAAIAAVAGAIKSGNERKQAETEIQNRIDSINAQEKARQATLSQAQSGDFYGQYGFDEIFGTKPEGIDPISVNEGLSRNISQIRGQGLPSALEFTGKINQQFSDQTLDLNLQRINNLIPNFREQTGQINNVTNDLLHGRLPFDDVLGIVSDRSSLAASLGAPGGSTNATLKDLGLSRLDAIGQGFSMFNQFAQTLQSAVSPTPNFARGDEILPYTSLTGNQRVEQELATTRALQAAELIRSGADPAASELFKEEFLFQQTAASTRAGTKVPNTIAGDAAAEGLSTYADYYREDQVADKEAARKQQQNQQASANYKNQTA